VTVTPDPTELFSVRHLSYARFIRLMRYPQGLRAFFDASLLPQSGMRALDAGCGTGAVLLALREAFMRRKLTPAALHAFDLTPAMLDHFRHTLQRHRIDGVELAQANVLQLDALPDGWRDYDLIASASMLEYVPRERLVEALGGLHDRLGDGGTFVLFMTRRNPLTRLLVGRWWRANLYSADELTTAFLAAGFSSVRSRTFPLAAGHLRLWGHVVQAQR
jgi:SAM-dependent methyltransferase